MMTPADFMHEYEQKTNTHNFANIATLIAADAIYWFNDGSFQGLDQIQAAFERTWNLIKDEHYSIENVQWIAASGDIAVGIYLFRWQGLINGHLTLGTDRGTSILRKENGRWVVVHEHLSPIPV